MGNFYVTTVILLIFSLSHNFFINAELHHKKSPLGFQAVRGKRSIVLPTSDSIELLKNDIPTNNLPLNSESSFVTLKPDNKIGNEITLTMHKRASDSFSDQRGKKDSEYTDFYKPSLMDPKNTLDSNYLLNYPIRYNVNTKRAPSGFMGMRGKKFYEDLYYYNDPKRAPSGFMGMRGKKENSDLINNNQNQLEKNDFDYENLEAQQLFFLSELAKYYELQNLLNSNNENIKNNLNEMFDKRAPSGFMGMRGKKLFIDENGNLNEIDQENYEKRAPAAGFFGMRGKKTTLYDDISYDDYHKRAPMKGFQGMRGKKDISNVLTPNELEEMKRAPAAGFFGMRGKKQPMGSGFFGMRGKKGPYEFRDKFVGVRGKKTSDEQGDEQIQQLQNQRQRMRQYRLNGDIQSYAPSGLLESDVVNEKRVPSGFYGVRGKKWIDVESSEKDK